MPSQSAIASITRTITVAGGVYAPGHLGELTQVVPFELVSPPVSSSEVRDRVARGEPIDDLVPAGVAEAIRDLGLYRGYTDRDSD